MKSPGGGAARLSRWTLSGVWTRTRGAISSLWLVTEVPRDVVDPSADSQADESEEGLRVAPPILSRVHQVLTDGMLGFNQADKISTTPFPMPYSQMLTRVSAGVQHHAPADGGGKHQRHVAGDSRERHQHGGVPRIERGGARELEDPFKPTHLNDVGMPQLQAMFNSKIRAGTPGSGKHLEHWNKCSRRVERGLSFASADAEGSDANGTS